MSTGASDRRIATKLIESIDVSRNYILNETAFDNTNGWATYDDGASPTPTNGTGGSPTVVTISRNTSSPIRGVTDFQISKSAADGQGEGTSYDFTIDSFDKNKTLSVEFDYTSSANFVAGTSSDLRVFMYDVTNTQLLPLTNIYLISETGTFRANFQTTTSTSYRLILHVATTNALAWTLNLARITVSNKINLAGSVQTDWQSYTPTFGGFGTATNINTSYRRIGDTMQIRGSFQAGTTTGSDASLTLPAGFLIDFNKGFLASTAVNGLGHWTSTNSTAQNISSDDREGLLFSDGSTSNTIYFAGTNGTDSNLFNTSNGNEVVNSNGYVTIEISIPIEGWTSETAIAPSGIIRMSQILPNGTRVTGSDPDQLGEYRTLIKDNAATTLSDNAPSGTPTSADGMHIYVTSGTGAGTSGQPNRWIMFIGKYKSYRIEYYSTTGKTGFMSTDYFLDAGATGEVGLESLYDPNTGILTVTAPIATTSDSRNVGYAYTSTTGASATTDCYFDVIVADNDFQIQLASDLNQPVYIKDIKAANTSGGTFTSGAWQTRDLNTVENSKPWLISLTANQFTLDTGTYDIYCEAPAFNVNRHKAKLWNDTDSTDTIIGSSEQSTGAVAATHSDVVGIFTITAPKTFEIQHQAETTATTNGFGSESNFGVNEVYTQVKLIKLS